MRLIVVFTGVLLLSACAVSPSKRFPNFYQQMRKFENVALVIDVLPVADIDGNVDGVYENTVRQSAVAMANAAKATLEQRGYHVRFVHVNSGLFESPDLKLVFAKDDKRASGFLKLPFLNPDDTPWTDTVTRAFLRNAMTAARSGNNDGARSVPVPDTIQALPVDAFVLLQIRSRDVGMGKTIGVGVLTGLLTGFATMPVSGADADMAIIHSRDGTVLWHNTVHNQGRTNGLAFARPSMDSVLNAVPSRGKPVTDGDVVIRIPDGVNTSASNAEAAQAEETAGGPTPWTVNSAKQALRESRLSKVEYDNITKPLVASYRLEAAELQKALKSGKIDESTYKVELQKVKLRYLGG